MNNPFDYMPDAACDEAFRKLVAELESLKGNGNPDDADFIRELEEGKMLGVLIASDGCGARHTLYAFSGQLGGKGFHRHGFAGPVFDYLQPDGYFKTREADISRRNADISVFEESILPKIRSDYERAKEKMEAEIADFREKCRLSKSERDAKRKSGSVDEAELAAMIRLSQFEKAELHRLKKRLTADIEPLAAALDKALSELETMKQQRRADSDALQKWLFSNFKLLNARGESMSLSEIFAETPMRIPPSGAGECCAPKLLQAAYLKGWRPVAMAEYWYGRPKGGEIRVHGEHYPACRGKCLPVLGWMLQGLNIVPPLGSESLSTATPPPRIIYENRWFCVVDKPAGMLSVPGKGAAISVQQWLTERYGSERDIKMAHRLDRDTSGLLIATFGSLPYKIMQSLFATRKVQKTYIALLDGDYESVGLPPRGRIELPLSPDWLDRPRQRVDLDGGKMAVTDYEFTGISHGRSRIMLHPLTGRTHQLRVHAASLHGLGLPIAGDPLYGKKGGERSQRLHLHAHKIQFIFPIDAQEYSFISPVPF